MKSDRYPHPGIVLAIFVSLIVQLWAQTAYCCSDPYGYLTNGCSDKCIADCPDQPLPAKKPCGNYSTDENAKGCLSRPFTWESAFNGTRLEKMVFKHPHPLAIALLPGLIDSSAATNRSSPICELQQEYSDTFLSMRTTVLLI